MEKRVSAKMKEFNRKIELGKKLKFILIKHGNNGNGWDNYIMIMIMYISLSIKLINLFFNLKREINIF